MIFNDAFKKINDDLGAVFTNPEHAKTMFASDECIKAICDVLFTG